ncbi:MAG: L-lysine 2,3-aminomutase, partial [Chlamydiae bacterium]|nr:L-lysine 2,3-aminomutase [Chlamydiota bacterium]
MLTTLPWREIQRQNFTSLESLADFLELSHAQITKLDLHSPFPLNLPLRLAQKIPKSTLDDPIFRQFVPQIAEKIEKVGFSCDPLGESQARPTPKLLHKYKERALMLPTSGCAMNCRYCFRRHFAYETEKSGLDEELAYIRADTTLREIILSGGDPLALSNS